MRYNAQEMVWRSILPAIERDSEQVRETATKLSAAAEKGGATLTVDDQLDIPRYVSAVDVHLMPGNYTTEYGRR